MITRKLTISFVIIAIMLSLTLPTPAYAENERIYFTGYESGCDSAVIDRDWASGPNYHLRIDTQTCYEVGDIPQFTGTLYAYDGVINVSGGGSMITINGKFRMETEEGGVWVGSFERPANTNILRGVGHGEGMYEGQHIYINNDQLSGIISGYTTTD